MARKHAINRWLETCARLSLATGFVAICTPAHSNEVRFNFERELELENTKLPYELALDLNSVSPVRIGLNALLDLQQLQENIPTLLAGTTLVDACNTRIELGAFSIKAANDAIGIAGLFEADFFQCERDKLDPIDRGELLFSQSLTMAASASVAVREQCVHFRFDNLEFQQDGPLELSAEQQEFLARAKGLMLDASDRFLSRFPICPELPASLASLDPDFQSGGTREIGDGGLGVFLEGSIDVSTSTILDVLASLQARGVLPPAP